MNIKAGKKAIHEVTADDLANAKVVQWAGKVEEMTQAEVEQIKNLNWEWYYNSYLYGDQAIQVACKRCGHFNWFEPGQKAVVCETCGENCKRCEKEEL